LAFYQSTNNTPNQKVFAKFQKKVIDFCEPADKLGVRLLKAYLFLESESMKLQENTNTIVRSGSFEESNYSIEASAKAFSILSDGLYANKIKAVVRELSTNAYDSHVDAGCPEKPFVVHMPHRMEQYFSIRDFGTGLSHEDCMNLYTTYFGSNKTNTNDAVGCLGLGSKSPFAYTDSFSVTSYFNGVKRTYNAYKNEHDQPVFALLDESNTSEPNGVEVTFAVDEYDCGEFCDEAEEVYKYFNTQPEFLGHPMEVEKFDYTVEGDFWKVRSERYGHSVAIMGQVAYPIEADVFEGDIFTICQAPINIYFEIGELDITPSREALSYNKYTKDAIESKVKAMLLEMVDVVSESFESSETLWDARIKYCQLTDRGNWLNKLTGIFDDTELKWKDKDLWEGGGWSMAVNFPEGSNVKHIYKDDYKTSISSDDRSKMVFTSKKKIHVYIDDLGRGGIGRSREYVRGLIPAEKYGENEHEMYLFRNTTVEAICEVLGCNPEVIKKTSDLPSTTSYRRSSGGSGVARSKVAVWETDGNRGYWRDTEVDMQEGGYYVEIHRYEIFERKDGNKVKAYVGCQSMVNILKSHGNDELREALENGEIKIYGIKSATINQKKFNANGQWINALDFARTVVASKYLDDIESWYPEFLNWYHHATDRTWKHLNKIMVLCSSPPTLFKEYADMYSKYSDKQEEADKYQMACSKLSMNRLQYRDIEVNENLFDWEKKYEQMLETIPLVGLYVEHRSYGYWEDEETIELAKYVDMIGEKNEN